MSQNILHGVTPTSATLLQWWFGHRPRHHRTHPAFNERQRQAILGTIAAHETRGSSSARPIYPVLPVPLTCGVDQIRVALALMTWQLLNHRVAREARVDDGRFTSHFLLVAPQACVRSRLFDALSGKAVAGGYGLRNFATSDLARLAPMFIPESDREETLNFFRWHTGPGTQALRQARGDGIVAITDGRVEALECLARLSPDAMVFDDETRPPFCARNEDPTIGRAWQHHLRRVAASRNGCGVQVVFKPNAPSDGAGATPVTS